MPLDKCQPEARSAAFRARSERNELTEEQQWAKLRLIVDVAPRNLWGLRKIWWNRRQLGRSGLEVSAIGLGCMGMSQSYGTPDDAESIRTIHRAIDLGVTLIDTADQ